MWDVLVRCVRADGDVQVVQGSVVHVQGSVVQVQVHAGRADGQWDGQTSILKICGPGDRSIRIDCLESELLGLPALSVSELLKRLGWSLLLAVVVCP